MFLILLGSDAFAQWSMLPPMNQPRSDSMAVSDGGNALYVFGGIGALHFLDNAEKYSVQGGWVDISGLPNPLAFADAAYIDGKVYICGGFDGSLFSQELLIYDVAGDSYTQGAPIPEILHGYRLNAYGEQLYLTGGANDQDQSQNTHLKYDPLGDSWSSLSDMTQARSYHGSAVLDDVLYVFGGKDGSLPTPQYISSTESYEFTSNTWSAGPDMPVTFLYGSSGSMDAQAMACHGLQGGQQSADCYAYTSAAKGWTSTDAASVSRYRVSSCNYDEGFYVLGGIEVSPQGPVTSNQVEFYYSPLADDDDDDDDNDNDDNDNNDDNNNDDNDDNDDNDVDDTTGASTDSSDDNDENGCCG